ncbi:SSI family serine proteinase inhibitor [Streptosporangium sp. NPDC087985]|uniref:SSI family serine proteinase inhibitor n=1 Tax=Streptosporangium sp. NPDC087985 TaxID=3366196 RepID=UPI0037F903CD
MRSAGMACAGSAVMKTTLLRRPYLWSGPVKRHRTGLLPVGPRCLRPRADGVLHRLNRLAPGVGPRVPAPGASSPGIFSTLSREFRTYLPSLSIFWSWRNARCGFPSASAGPIGDPLSGASTVRPDAPAESSSVRTLVLGISEGPAILPMTRAVVLQCAPMGGGTHPRTPEACAALEPVNGELSKIEKSSGAICTLNYQPVTASSVGVWDDRFILSARTYGNACQARDELGAVGAF